MNTLFKDPVSIIGAGLAGTLLAIHLARRGMRADVFERYPDQREEQVPSGRSINLAIAARGRKALAAAGLLEAVDEFTVPMRGRMLHDEQGRTTLERYSQFEDEVIYSVYRDRLNACLLRATEAYDGIRMHFHRRLEQVDFERQRALFCDPRDGRRHTSGFRRLIGCDGAGSALRRCLQQVLPMQVESDMLSHGYIELSVPPGAGGQPQLDPHALHVWPRGGYMMIALPNADASFTATLFLPHRGDPGFDHLQRPEHISEFLQREFSDLYPLLGDLDADLERPVGSMGTLHCDRWHLDGLALLLGDAAHAVVPFHGQGMNAAFEDITLLVSALDSGRYTSWPQLFAEFSATRKPDTDALAAMALENYRIMRDAVRDPRYHLKKQLEWELERRFPDRFIPRYSMVMFRHIPYAEARERGRIQAEIVATLLEKAGGDPAKPDWQLAGELICGRLAQCSRKVP